MPRLLVEGCVTSYLSGIARLLGGRICYTMEKNFVDEFKKGLYMLRIFITLIIYKLSFFTFFHNPFSTNFSLYIYFHLTFLFITSQHILMHPPFSHDPSLYIPLCLYIPLSTPPYHFPTWKEDM